MSFWGSNRISERINDIIVNGRPSDDNIDCSAYTLRMGKEVYITRTGEPSESKGHTKIELHEGQHFEIPAGQFAFLLTEESIRIPNDVMALISIKARWKFRGLVNVSGFHVDPGYKGHLVFAVFNAGPSPITLCRGQKLFLMWFADLVEHSSKKVKKDNEVWSMSPDLVNYLSGNVYSPMALKERIDDNKKYIDDEIHKLRVYILGLFMAVILALLGVIFKGILDAAKDQSEHAAMRPLSNLAERSSTSSRESKSPIATGTIIPRTTGAVSFAESDAAAKIEKAETTET